MMWNILFTHKNTCHILNLLAEFGFGLLRSCIYTVENTSWSYCKVITKSYAFCQNHLYLYKFLMIIRGNSIFNLARGGLYFVTSAFLFLQTFRQAAGGNKGPRYDVERKVKRESRAVPAPDANAELVLSMQV